MSSKRLIKKRSSEIEVPLHSDFHTTSFKVGPLTKFPVHPETDGSSSPDDAASASTLRSHGHTTGTGLSRRGFSLSSAASLRRFDNPGHSLRRFESRSHHHLGHKIKQAGPHAHIVEPLKRSMNRSNVVRVRANKKATAVKFSVMAAEEDDPLRHKNIMKAKNYRNWFKDASKALPSQVGVPIQDSDDLVQAGFSAVVDGEARRGSLKDAYNKVFDQLLKRHTPEHAGVHEALIDARDSLLSQNSSNNSTKTNNSTTADAEKTYAKKLEALKMLPETLTEKRRLKLELTLQVNSAYTYNNNTRQKRGRYGTLLQQVQRYVHDVIKYLTIWKSSIQRIHGKFGISAGAYFEWLRTILMLNVLYLVVIGLMIYLPEMLIDYDKGNHISTHDEADCYPHMKICKTAQHKAPPEPFSLTDIFSGMGSFINTRVYYGGYRDPQAHPHCPALIKAKNDTTNPKSLFMLTSFRFTMTVFFIFLISSSFVSYQVTHYYHVARMTSRVPGLKFKDHFKAVLCAWDFSICEKVAADAMHKSIWRELKDLGSQLENLKNKITVQPDRGSLFHFMKIFRLRERSIHSLLHILANIGIMVVYGVASWGLWASFYERNKWYATLDSNICDRTIQPPEHIMILPAIFISFSNGLVTKVCTLVGNCESWSTKENKSWALLGRVGTYYILIIIVLCGYWYWQSHSKEGLFCHEEALGQDIYRIVVVQGILEIFGGFVIAHFTHVYRERKNPHYAKPAFDATNGSLNLFFLHTLSGFGFFYCPIICGVVILRLVALFYVRKYTLMNLCSHPMHIFQVSELYAPYILNFFISYLITAILNTILLAELYPSKNCGPFTHYYWTPGQKGYKNKTHYWDVFSHGINSTNTKPHYAFIYMTKPAAAVVIIMLLAGLVHTFRAWAKAYTVTMANLHDLLLLERKDRDFLLKAIFKLVRKSHQKGMSDDHIIQQLVEETPTQRPMDTGTTRKKTNVHTELAQGVFKSRNGSMAKRETFEIPLGENSLRRVDSEERELLQRGAYMDVLHEATAIAPHATFGLVEVDNWMKAFMDSNRSGRRGAEIINPNDLKKVRVEKPSVMKLKRVETPSVQKLKRVETPSVQKLKRVENPSVQKLVRVEKSSIKQDSVKIKMWK